jgi:hypothetical protein
MQITGHPTDCAPAREAVSARLDAPLPELDEARLEAHLDACADCRTFAADLAGVASILRAAPLEQPRIPLFMPRSRRPVFRLQTAAAAVVLLSAAVGSSFALGRALGHEAPAAPAATGPADVLSLRADSTQQHLLAMLSRGRPAASVNVGKAIAL